MRKRKCLVVGNVEHGDMRSPVAWLEEHAAVTRVATATEATGVSAECSPFDLLVIAQTRPGEFAACDVESLHQAWPLARLVGLLGSWCDGEGRTGRPWPGVWRVPATSFRICLHDWIRLTEPQLAGSWQLPRLATAAERFHCEAETMPAAGKGLVLIAASNYPGYESLADAVAQFGYGASWLSPRLTCSVRGVSIVLWDAARNDEAEWRAIEELAGRGDPIGGNSPPMVVLVGFPRADDLARAERLSTAVWSVTGKVAVLAKPFRLVDLSRELARVTRGSERESRAVKSA